MYLYMDESGNAGFDLADPQFLKNGAEPFLVFALVVIEDKKTKQRIERIIRQTVSDLVKLCKKKNAGQVPKELKKGVIKGTLLTNYPQIRLELFQRLASPVLKWHAFVALFDKRTLRPQLPEDESRRYSLLFRNVFLSSYSVPRNQRIMTLIVDKRYPWKERRKLFNQMLVATFRSKRKPGSRSRLWIFHGEPEAHTPIQLADILSNFGRQRLRLGERLPSRTSAEQKLIEEEDRKEELREWQDAFDIIEDKLSWRKPLYFGRGIVEKLPHPVISLST
jgi:uncharacterized protein DUF3800